MGGVYSMPWRPPPVTVIGGRQRSPWPVTRAPISRRGSATRSIGLPRSESSPVRVVVPESVAATPASRRIPVPELPRSTGSTGAWSSDRPPCTVTFLPWCSTTAPRAATAAEVRATSSPSDSPVMVDVPSASAASSRARCEMDLSPGTSMVPTRGRPPATWRMRPPSSVPAGCGPVLRLTGSVPSECHWTGSHARSGRRGGRALRARPPPAPARRGRPPPSGRSRCRRGSRPVRWPVW